MRRGISSYATLRPLSYKVLSVVSNVAFVMFIPTHAVRVTGMLSNAPQRPMSYVPGCLCCQKCVFCDAHTFSCCQDNRYVELCPATSFFMRDRLVTGLCLFMGLLFCQYIHFMVKHEYTHFYVYIHTHPKCNSITLAPKTKNQCYMVKHTHTHTYTYTYPHTPGATI